MKSKILILLLCFGLMNYKAMSKIGSESNEILMAHNCKLIQHGYFTFLVYINEKEINELVYWYSIDIKNKKVTCSKHSQIYSASGEGKYSKHLNFKTAEHFKREQSNTWREKYFKCFDDRFLEMTNQEKIDLLDKLSLSSKYTDTSI